MLFTNVASKVTIYDNFRNVAAVVGSLRANAVVVAAADDDAEAVAVVAADAAVVAYDDQHNHPPHLPRPPHRTRAR